MQAEEHKVPGVLSSRSLSGQLPLQRGVSDGSALVSHFDDWATVLDSEAETSLSRRGSGKLHGLEPDMLRSTVDGLLKRQSAPSKLHAPVDPQSLSLTAAAIMCTQDQHSWTVEAAISSFQVACHCGKPRGWVSCADQLRCPICHAHGRYQWAV